MKRELLLTADGSHTMAVPAMDVTYHSRYGAVQESMHVFIHAGLHNVTALPEGETLHVLEMGFGTGLNALLTFRETLKNGRSVYYRTVELFPLTEQEALMLNYVEQLGDPSLGEVFAGMHAAPWGEDVQLTPAFTLHKSQANFPDLQMDNVFHLVYYDAFAPGAQPELWEQPVFEKLFRSLHPGGTLVTYCSKGNVRRNMTAAGFRVEKLPGPRGKREMLRAVKPSMS